MEPTVQAKTALADTPGSVFLTEVATLIQEQRWEQYVTKMLGQLDLVFSKATDKGGWSPMERSGRKHEHSAGPARGSAAAAAGWRKQWSAVQRSAGQQGRQCTVGLRS